MRNLVIKTTYISYRSDNLLSLNFFFRWRPHLVGGLLGIQIPTGVPAASCAVTVVAWKMHFFFTTSQGEQSALRSWQYNRCLSPILKANPEENRAWKSWEQESRKRECRVWRRSIAVAQQLDESLHAGEEYCQKKNRFGRRRRRRESRRTSA